jgi:ketosteroid isomerase-like protein
MDRLSESEQVLAVLHQINQAWLGGRVAEMAAWMHPGIVMVAPGFVGRAVGREAFLAGFEDFVGSCKIEEFREMDHQADVVGAVAVVNLRFEMVYARAGERHRAMGRDVWVFERERDSWTAVWRTMLDMQEVGA